MNIVFESETVRYVAQLWFVYKLLGICVALAVLIGGYQIVKWFMSGAKNYLTWKKESSLEEFRTDALKWEHEIDKRVSLLGSIRSEEMQIREELDALHEVKGAVDARRQAEERLSGGKK